MLKIKYRNLLITIIVLIIVIFETACNKEIECEKQFYKNGNLKQTVCENDQGGYIRSEFDTDGIILWEAQLDKNKLKHGFYKEYFKSGKIKAEANFVNDKQSGKMILYYENGKIEQEGYYKEGKKNGFYKFYYPNGNLEQDEIWENGVALYYKKIDSLLQVKEEYHSIKILSENDTINRGESYKAKIVLMGALDRNKKWDTFVLFGGPGLNERRKPISNNGKEALFESPKLNSVGKYVFLAFSTIDTYKDSTLLQRYVYVK